VTPCFEPKLRNGDGNHTSLTLRIISLATREAESGQCVIRIGGVEINSASFAMYTFSLAVLAQALVLVTFSPLADCGAYIVLPHMQRLTLLIRQQSKTSASYVWIYGIYGDNAFLAGISSGLPHRISTGHNQRYLLGLLVCDP
jgi:hypothetical protein